MKKALIFVLILLLAAASGALWANRAGPPEFETKADVAFEPIDAQAAGPEVMYNEADFAGVPEPARQYLKKALPKVGLRARVVLIRQSGRTMMAEDSSWDAYTARQITGMNPPRLAWAATADWAPWIPVMTLTSYSGDSASVRSYFFGMVDAFENQGMVIKAYLLQRWLAEAVWYPSALLPGGKVRWEQADTKVKGAKMVRAIVEDGGIKVSGRFVFGGGGAPMFFLGDPLPFGHLAGQNFYCNYSDWRRQGDRQIPFEIVQGVRRGISDDRRLEAKLESIEYR